jgi:hypothetical protein
MNKINNIFTNDHYIGTIIEVGLNHAKMRLNSSIKMNYSTANNSLIDLGRVNEFCIIYCINIAILGKINYISTPEKENKNIENKVNNINKEQISATAYIQYLGIYNLLSKEILFEKGISKYPQVSDRVYSVTEDWIEKCFDFSTKNSLLSFNIGKVHNFESIDVKLHPETIFTKHTAIVGSTGSGKSNSLSKIIENFLDLKETNGKMILIDPTGEYKNIYTNNQDVVKHSGENWHIDNSKLSLNDWFALLTPSSQTQAPCLDDSIVEYNRRKKLNNNNILEEFNNRKEEYEAKDYYNKNIDKNEGFRTPSLTKYYNDNDNIIEKCKMLSNIIEEKTSRLNFGNLGDSKFDYSHVQPMINRIRGMEKNDEMHWLFPNCSSTKKENNNFVSNLECNDSNEVNKEDNKPENIHSLIDNFLSEEANLFIIDCSLLTNNHSSKEFFVNLLNRYLLTIKKDNYKKDVTETKDTIYPLLLCIDEAHQFLNKKMNSDNDSYDLNATSIIAKEGRKYGLHLVISTQRPRDIPEDILSQIGFILTHRLTNEGDQNLIKSAVSYVDENIMKALPMLPTGHAFLFSLDFKMPIQIQINKARPENQPQSKDVKWLSKKL